MQEIGITDISIHALELPGRGNRAAETLITNTKAAIADYTHQINSKRNGAPYIIYGHSMGAIMGLYIVNKMEAQKDAPLQFIATGTPGPGIEKAGETPVQKKYTLPDEDFKNFLKELGGIPEEILTNKELFDFFSPILRADFQVIEEDTQTHTIIHTPIHAIMGSTEPKVAHIQNWKTHTTSAFKAQILPGNHFFIYKHPDVLIKTILNYYQQKKPKP